MLKNDQIDLLLDFSAINHVVDDMNREDYEEFVGNREKFIRLSSKMVQKLENEALPDKYFDICYSSTNKEISLEKEELIFIDTLGFAHVGHKIKELANYFLCSKYKEVYMLRGLDEATVVDIMIESEKNVFKAIPMALEENRYFLPTVGFIVTLLENGKTIYSKAYKLYTA